jgi:hypothetical protein
MSPLPKILILKHLIFCWLAHKSHEFRNATYKTAQISKVYIYLKEYLSSNSNNTQNNSKSASSSFVLTFLR